MKSVSIVSVLFALSATSAFANTYDIDLNTNDTGACDARVAEVARALEGQPIRVTNDQQVEAITTGGGDATTTDFVPGDCNAQLTSTGSAQIVLKTVKFRGDCTDRELSDSAFANAVYINAYNVYGKCVVDAISLN